MRPDGGDDVDFDNGNYFYNNNNDDDDDSTNSIRETHSHLNDDGNEYGGNENYGAEDKEERQENGGVGHS